MERCGTQMIEYRSKAAEMGIQLPAPPVSPHSRLGAAITQHQPEEEQLPADFSSAVTAWLTAARALADAAVSPAPTTRESTLVELGVLVGQAGRWRDLAAKANRARKAHEFANTMFQVYAASQKRTSPKS